MKILYLAVALFPILLIAIGCSSTYRVTDYPSKEKFQEDINSSIKDRDINVATVDSSFISSAGSEIKGDSLLTVAKIQEEKISLKDVKDIKYIEHGYEEPSAYLWLKNGEKLRPEGIKILPDSMIQLTNLRINSKYVSINKIKEISYKTRWQSTLIGIPLGFAGGALTGGIIGATGIIIHINDGGNHPTFDSGTSMMVGAALGVLIGTVTGAIVGYIVGWDHIYQFSN